MLKNITKRLTSLYHSSNECYLFFFYFLFAFFIRFPFFFRDYIDRDESTFILMGQSWVDGFLPYTQLWDLKPPITFLFFASIIYVFGKSFLAIRIAGVILVSLTAFFTYKIGASIAQKKIGFWSGFFVLILSSLFGSLQGVMSEHISITFFISALYLLIIKKSNFSYLLAGLLLGLSLMTKLNLAYSILFIFLFLAWKFLKEKQVYSRLIKIFILGGAILSIILLTALPYYLNSNFQTWWTAVFKASLAYSGSKEHSIFKVIPLALLVVSFFIITKKKKLIDYKQKGIQLLLIASFGILFSFMKIGKANGHYLIQLYPTLLILIVIAINNTKILKNLNYKPIVLVMAFLIPMETYLEFKNIIDNKIKKGSFYNGEGIAVPNYFKEKQISSNNILFLEYHIGYWLLDKIPPTKSATHPSNILREELFPHMQNTRKTKTEEIKFIFEDIRPNYIITRKNRRVFDKKVFAVNFYTNLQLLKNYTVLDTVESAVIHKRLELK